MFFLLEGKISGIDFLSTLEIQLATKLLEEEWVVVFQQDGTPFYIHNEVCIHRSLVAKTAENVPFR